jgi:hypothetical protein
MITRTVLRTTLAAVVIALVAGNARPSFALPDTVIKDFGNQLSAKICSDGGAWLSCYRLDPSRCKGVIGEFVSSCAAQSLGQVVGVMSYQEALAKARHIDACVNEKFLGAYGFQRERSAECAKPPPHLRGEDFD